MQFPAQLLSLPGELRNQIDRDYLCDDNEDGYVNDFEAGKLRKASNQPIELDLIAARWAYFVSRFRSHVGWYKVTQIVPAEVVQEVVGSQSFIHAIFCHYKNSSLPSFDRVAKAVTEPACRADVGTPTEHENSNMTRDDGIGGLAAYLDIIKEPWRIPTDDELDRIGARLPIRKREASAALRDMWRDHPGRFRFSAAAAAICFLNSLPTTTRKHIRRIHLDEDRVSVSHPECPIRGRLPFYLENAGLMIERRASLWNNLFQARAWGEASGQFLDPFSGFTVGLLNWARRTMMPCQRTMSRGK
ncbi:LOW QUALITY PROTEIN: hypothetical protein QC761_404890 [Podospora bellae-mahoneyi]|uniref:Uncharacterized protein n=1 Tax=Podospora bellae-mahoneyi TaxID=2093777 RepID=A0ABR0FK43_9PEZI|nr:LOW QUALITY PROTEIN: hypothetical protein QC761_404890 [Podospora bellae-mahoneyi]